MTEWNHIVRWILDAPECKNIHKLAYPSAGWIYLTRPDGTRHKITEGWKLKDVKELVNCITHDKPFIKNETLSMKTITPRTAPLIKNSKPAAHRKPLSDDDEIYILGHYKSTPVFTIAKELNHDAGAIYRFLDKKGLEAFSTKPFIPRANKKVKSGYFNSDDFKNMAP